MNKQDSGEDRISALSNDIIRNILSNLYVEESVRTSILSKRWRNMWLFSPLTISDESIVKQSYMYCLPKEESSSWIKNTISYIIYTHPSPIHTCHFILPDWYEYHKTVVNLLKTLTLKGIQNLLIDIGRFDVPCFVLECDSLVNVDLRYGSMPAQFPAHMDIFPNLRKLTLTEYNMNNQCLVSLLSSRSIIELELLCCYGFTDVVIESDNLQKLYFKGNLDYYVVHLTIKDAPNLESFKCNKLPKHSEVVILNAPKLKVLRHIDMEMSKLQLGNYQFDFYEKYVKISGEITYMPALRSLKIAVDFGRAYEVKSIAHILMCFPCLETLEVCLKPELDIRCIGIFESKVRVDDAAAIVIDDDYDDYVRLMPNVNCLNHHLKNVRVSNYPGRRTHLDFVKLIIANAKVLETLTIVYGSGFEERRLKAQKHLLMQSRASKMLQVEFFKREYKPSSTLLHS